MVVYLRRKPVEAQIERYFVSQFKKHFSKTGAMQMKFTSPNRDSVPDRIVFICGARVDLIELKRPGKDLRPKQELVARDFRGLGIEVRVIDTKEKVDQYILDLLERVKTFKTLC